MVVLSGEQVVQVIGALGVTHLVWIPDSALGEWQGALERVVDLELIRPCREGEALGIGAGLWLGGKRPLVAMQCTGFFEAGDAFRNVVHDLAVPLWLIVGARSYFARRRGIEDSAAHFAEPILAAWKVGYQLLERPTEATEVVALFRRAEARREPFVLVIAE